MKFLSSKSLIVVQKCTCSFSFLHNNYMHIILGNSSMLHVVVIILHLSLHLPALKTSMPRWENIPRSSVMERELTMLQRSPSLGHLETAPSPNYWRWVTTTAMLRRRTAQTKAVRGKRWFSRCHGLSVVCTCTCTCTTCTCDAHALMFIVHVHVRYMHFYNTCTYTCTVLPAAIN